MLLANHTNVLYEAGCDEAGRGCLAGPVYAAAVVFPKGYTNQRINDSKKLNHQQREELCAIIEEEAISFSVQKCSHTEIDKINILNASFKAMHKALNKLSVKPNHIIVDGNRFKPYKKIGYSCIIKGDGKYISIAAASILAKVYRDRYMLKMDKRFPGYAWSTNKGYPTLAHRKAIKELGVSLIHRQSFQLLKPEQLGLFP